MINSLDLVNLSSKTALPLFSIKNILKVDNELIVFKRGNSAEVVAEIVQFKNEIPQNLKMQPFMLYGFSKYRF